MTEQKHTHDPLNVDEALSTSEAFLLKNKNLLLGVVIALVVIVGGYLGYKHFISEPKEQKASEAIFKGEQYFGDDNFEIALKGDSLGYAGFIKLADQFSGTDAGNLANAYAGLCYAQLGKYEDAIKYLDKFSGNDLLVAPAVMGALGNCYAQVGQLDKAVATLLKAAEHANSMTLSPIYLIQAGQILEKQGKNAEAVDAYKQVKNKYGNSYQAMDIDKYIERASLK
ncbi:tetratricopeptide repeat protein [Bacteroides mediterraneensis]|uniref:Tetratricopeptide repeat protein n=1 Tax=Bacteroides mediterraneensis TaxID=1841856 RepID=A0ABS2ETR4_9BACE|nr:tetratricopeptide repeat protein [Bacteroides mediterraneensis]MBM6757963.1 tetratricopeptide repeat protein [Bacteroides mediterraneensis]MBM6780088.1 tetratricopeptide repeat protein [Bacteroides mediterraneensis]